MDGHCMEGNGFSPCRLPPPSARGTTSWQWPWFHHVNLVRLPLTALPAWMELVDHVGLALASDDDRAVLRLEGLQRGTDLQWTLLRGVPNALISSLIERTEVRGYSEAISVERPVVTRRRPLAAMSPLATPRRCRFVDVDGARQF